MIRRQKIYTEYLNYNTASNILHAFDFAKFIRRPLNLLITINFYSDENAALKFKKIRQLYSNWIVAKRKKSGMTSYLNPWVYVFENPHSNIHVHWALHIEDDLIFELYEKIRKWVKKYTGSVKSKQINFRPINIFKDKSLANYLVKGVNSNTAYRLNLLRYKKYQGFVKGQRARVSLCLGKTARRKAKFNPKLDRNKWSTLHPDLMVGHVRSPDWNLNLVVAPTKPLKYLSCQPNGTARNKRARANDLKKHDARNRISSHRRHHCSPEPRQGRSGAAGRRNYATPALTTGKHFQYCRIS